MNDLEPEATQDRQRRERGATAVEYGLLVALIAAVIIVGVTYLGTSTAGLFEKTETEMVDAGM